MPSPQPSKPTRPEATQFECGQFFVHFMSYGAGAKLDTHKHKYPHMLLIASGSLLVTAAGVTERHAAPAVVNIPAEVAHDMVAETEALAACVHLCRLPDGTAFPFDWAPSQHSYDEAVAQL